MKPTAVSSLAIAAGLTALCLAPAFAQERPAPQGHGGADRAVSRPSGGGGGGGGSHSAPTPSGGSTGSSSGGTSAGAPSGGSHGGRAVPREGNRGTASARSRTGAAKPVIIPRGSSEAPGGTDVPHRERTNPRDPSYSRPRAGRPATGSAVPRDISGVPPQLWPQDPYWGYYYYSRWTPFYWGPWGGYMYYDPYWWDYYYGYGYFPYGYGGYGGYTHYYSESDYDTGGLKLKVKPREAQVYVDGYFSGVVDDYDGVFQKLRLRSGGHRIEIRAEDRQPAIFDVLVVAGETVTYRAELKPKP